jgi:hypothetical protein
MSSRSVDKHGKKHRVNHLRVGLKFSRLLVFLEESRMEDGLGSRVIVCVDMATVTSWRWVVTFLHC